MSAERQDSEHRARRHGQHRGEHSRNHGTGQNRAGHGGEHSTPASQEQRPILLHAAVKTLQSVDILLDEAARVSKGHGLHAAKTLSVFHKLIGCRINGKYLVKQVLKVGGMGVVLLAEHQVLQQDVAIKMLLPTLVGDDEILARFLREARVTARIKSEHVARIMDVGTLGTGAPFVVMEYLEGLDLEDLLREQGRLSISQAVDIVLQATEAIREAHQHGLVHRDLKPANLFLIPRQLGIHKVKVLDFGIVKRLGEAQATKQPLSLTNPGHILGSPIYMSPEQLRGAKVDQRADIWSLGVILYECMAGQRPFVAENVLQLSMMVVQDEHVPLGELCSDIPEELSELVDCCLEKDPAKRFASIEELRNALIEFATYETTAVWRARRSSTLPHRAAMAHTGMRKRIATPAQASRQSEPEIAGAMQQSEPDLGGAEHRSAPDLGGAMQQSEPNLGVTLQSSPDLADAMQQSTPEGGPATRHSSPDISLALSSHPPEHAPHQSTPHQSTQHQSAQHLTHEAHSSAPAFAPATHSSSPNISLEALPDSPPALQMDAAPLSDLPVPTPTLRLTDAGSHTEQHEAEAAEQQPTVASGGSMQPLSGPAAAPPLSSWKQRLISLLLAGLVLSAVVALLRFENGMLSSVFAPAPATAPAPAETQPPPVERATISPSATATAAKTTPTAKAKTAATKPRPASHSTVLTVATQPMPEIVWIDGVEWRGPVDRIELTPGVSHRITLIKPGYDSLHLRLTLEAGENRSVAAIMALDKRVSALRGTTGGAPGLGQPPASASPTSDPAASTRAPSAPAASAPAATRPSGSPIATSPEQGSAAPTGMAAERAPIRPPSKAPAVNTDSSNKGTAATPPGQPPAAPSHNVTRQIRVIASPTAETQAVQPLSSI